MTAPKLVHSFHRRTFLTGALAIASLKSARACPVVPPIQPFASTRPGADRPAEAWISYNAQLHARLADAGGGTFDDAFARDVLGRTNDLRRTLQLVPYEWSEALALCARAHAADMAARSYFAHESPEGFTHLHRVGLMARAFCGQTAENLAWRDFTDGSRPDDIETLWENSPGHRRNLLRDDLTSAGYGVVRLGDAYFAAAVYADVKVALAEPLPLWFEGRAEFLATLKSASPVIDHLALTRPFQPPAAVTTPAAPMPALERGAWQLRPLHNAGGARYSVVSGPLFLVS